MKRALRIDPYRPDRTELLGSNAGQFASTEIGKPVKYNGDQMDLCADTNEIVGFVTAVEAYTSDGHSVGSVRMDPGSEAYAVDEVGTMAVGDIAVSGTPTALATICPANGPNVKAAATPADSIHKWEVVAIVSGSGAGARLLLRKM